LRNIATKKKTLTSRVPKNSNFLYDLSPNLAKSSCGGWPVHGPHKIEKNNFDRQESVALKPVFLFAANFSPQKRKKVPCYFYRGFLFEKMIPIRHISKKKV